MSTIVKRGYSQNDPKEFGSKFIDKLLKAGLDLLNKLQLNMM